MKIRTFLFVAVFAVAIIVSLPGKASAAAPIGHLDTITADGKVEGWALRTDLPSSIPESQLIVHVYINGPTGKGTLATDGVANISRPDVNAAIGYAGNHGFSLSIPEQYKDGQNHSIYVYAIGGWLGPNSLLIGSPKTYNLGSSGSTTFRHPVGNLVNAGGTVYYMDVNTRNPFPSAAVFYSYGYSFGSVFAANSADLALAVGPEMTTKPSNTTNNKIPIGNLDVVHQGTNTVKGWAIDLDNQNTAVQIEVYFDGPAGASTVKATALGAADQPRPDVNSATGYSGNHGFTFNIPDALKDGMPHTAYVYMIDVNTSAKVQFSGSPKSFVMENLGSFNADIWADTGTIAAGGSTTIHWSVSPSPATTTITNIGAVSNGGSKVVSPLTSTTYTLTATYNGQTITKGVIVVVNTSQPVINSFTANSDNYSWSVSNATSISIRATYPNGGYNDYTNLQSSGTLTYGASYSTIVLRLVASNASGSVEQTVTANR